MDVLLHAGVVLFGHVDSNEGSFRLNFFCFLKFWYEKIFLLIVSIALEKYNKNHHICMHVMRSFKLII